MKFPSTNKISQFREEAFGENARLLEEAAKKVNWKYFFKCYSVALFVFLVTVFLIIVTVRFAMVLF